MELLSRLARRATLHKAWKVVASKRGVPGVDRVSVDELSSDLEKHLERLQVELETSAYRPLPVLRIRPSYLAAGDRALVVPAVRDRIVLRALADLLGPEIEPTLSPACRAFRKGSSAASAVADAGKWVEDGSPWVLRADVRKFFDTISTDRLVELLQGFVDREGLRFLRRVLRFRVYEHDEIVEQAAGIAQGSPFSPLLGNLYLSSVDHAMVEEFPRTLRYCDDWLVLAAAEGEVRRAHEKLETLLRDLELELNPGKTRVCRVEDGFVFLGYHFGPTGRGPATRAVEALHWRLGQLAEQDEIEGPEVDSLFRGWTEYFGERFEIWLQSPIGLLALLRRKGEAPGIDELVLARWKGKFEMGPGLALALARAWSTAGRLEMSWLELALRSGGAGPNDAELRQWAELLSVEEGALAALARRFTGPPADRLAAVGEALADRGAFEGASRMAALGQEALAGLAEPAGETGAARAADLPLLQSFFRGKEGVFAVEAVDRRGHRSFLPVHRPLGDDDWRAHLAGEKTLALPLVGSGNACQLGVLDIDMTKKALAEDPGGRERLRSRALGAALRLRRLLLAEGAESLLEDSGHKGHHLWVRLAEPVEAHRLRRWLLDLVEKGPAAPEGVRIEVFPDRDRVRPGGIGPIVKLPLGVHGKSGRWCSLLDTDGNPLADPFEALRGLQEVPVAVLDGRQPEASTQAAESVPAMGPRAARMIAGCRVLGHLMKRVEETSYLNHKERTTLLCTLGHLGGEGRDALHSIIGKTYNYRREVTDRHIDRLLEYPISCPRVRELHPEAVAGGLCQCPSGGRGKAYPSPVLQVLQPFEVAVFRRPTKAMKAGPTRAKPEKAPGGGAEAARSPMEDMVRKLAELRRHRRGLDAAIRRLTEQLAEVFDAEDQESLVLSMGTLRKDSADAEGLPRFVIEI